MYKIVGADQREYGPVTSEQVREWITQGRSNAQTLASFEGSPWKPLSTYPEFSDVLRTTVPPPVGQGTIHASGMFPGARTNTAAVWGLVLSIIGTCCSPLSIVGLALCVIGLVQIQNNPQQYTTSKVVPIVGIVIALLDLVFVGIAIASGAVQHILRNFPR